MYCATKGCFNQLLVMSYEQADTGLCKECYDKSLEKRERIEQLGHHCEHCAEEISPVTWCFHREHFYCKNCCESKK